MATEYARNEYLVAVHEFPLWPQQCMRCARCRDRSRPCERRDLGALIKLIEKWPFRGFVRVLCAGRLTDGVTETNVARLLPLLPNLEVIDLTKTCGLSFEMMRILMNKLQLVCIIDATHSQQLAERALSSKAEVKQEWLRKVVWLGAYDYDRFCQHSKQQEDEESWRVCSQHHHHWFRTVLLCQWR